MGKEQIYLSAYQLVIFSEWLTRTKNSWKNVAEKARKQRKNNGACKRTENLCILGCYSRFPIAIQTRLQTNICENDQESVTHKPSKSLASVRSDRDYAAFC